MSMMMGALVVIVLMHVIAGLLIHQTVEPYLRDESQPIALRREVFDYYGTFWRCTITMFEISLANWAPSCRVLINHYSEWYGIFFLVYRCGIGFAVLTVVQAVFIQQTIQSAQRNEEFAVWQKRKEQESQTQKLIKAFNNLDESGDGFITWNEFQPLLDSSDELGKEGRALMSLLGVDVKDAESLFSILAAGDDKIDLEEFINGMQNMNGMAKALDLVGLQHIVRRVETKMDKFLNGGESISQNSFQPQRYQEDGKRRISITKQLPNPAVTHTESIGSSYGNSDSILERRGCSRIENGRVESKASLPFSPIAESPGKGNHEGGEAERKPVSLLPSVYSTTE
jgi:hypothetical protein